MVKTVLIGAILLIPVSVAQEKTIDYGGQYMKQLYDFSPASKKRLDTCHRDVRYFLREAMRTTTRDIGDWSITDAYRDEDLQEHYFKEGKSQAHWGESDHNHRIGDKPCSLAVDVVPWCPIKKKSIYEDKELWKRLYAHFYSVAKRLNMHITCGAELKNGFDWPHISFKLKA